MSTDSLQSPTCRSCGAPFPPDARFCGECGQATRPDSGVPNAPSTTEAEARTGLPRPEAREMSAAPGHLNRQSEVRRLNLRLGLAGLLLTILGLAVGGFLFLGRESGGDSDEASTGGGIEDRIVERIEIPVDDVHARVEVADLDGPILVDTLSGVEVLIDPGTVDAQTITVTRAGPGETAPPGVESLGGVDIDVDGGTATLELRFRAPEDAIVFHNAVDFAWIPESSTYVDGMHVVRISEFSSFFAGLVNLGQWTADAVAGGLEGPFGVNALDLLGWGIEGAVQRHAQIGPRPDGFPSGSIAADGYPERTKGCVAFAISGWGFGLSTDDLYETTTEADAILGNLRMLVANAQAEGAQFDASHFERWYEAYATAAEAVQAARQGHSIVLIGHSAGGAAAYYVAQTLGVLGYPVDLLIDIDTYTGGGLGGTATDSLQGLLYYDGAIPPNVRAVVNRYQNAPHWRPVFWGRPLPDARSNLLMPFGHGEINAQVAAGNDADQTGFRAIDALVETCGDDTDAPMVIPSEPPGDSDTQEAQPGDWCVDPSRDWCRAEVVLDGVDYGPIFLSGDAGQHLWYLRDGALGHAESNGSVISESSLDFFAGDRLIGLDVSVDGMIAGLGQDSAGRIAVWTKQLQGSDDGYRVDISTWERSTPLFTSGGSAVTDRSGTKIAFVGDRGDGSELFVLEERTSLLRPQTDVAPAVPANVAISWDGAVIAWLGEGKWCVSRSGEPVCRPGMQQMFAIAISPDGSTALITGPVETQLVSTGDGTILQRFDLAGGFEPTFAADGASIALVAEGHLYLLGADGSVHRLTDTPDGAASPSFSADGRMLAYRTGQQVAIRYRQTAGPRPPLQDHGNTWGGRFSPDGSRLYFLSDQGGDTDIYVMDIGSGDVSRLTFSTLQETDLTPLADGRVLFKANCSNCDRHWPVGTLHIVDPSGRATELSSLAVQSYAIADDSRTVYFTIQLGILKLDLETGQAVQLNDDSYGYRTVATSGDQVFFLRTSRSVELMSGAMTTNNFSPLWQRGHIGGFDVSVEKGFVAASLSGTFSSQRLAWRALDGSRDYWLTYQPGFDQDNPVISPNGEWVAYTSNRDGYADIWLVRPDGTGHRNVSNHQADDWDPQFSPDSSALIYTSDRDSMSQIYWYEID